MSTTPPTLPQLVIGGNAPVPPQGAVPAHEERPLTDASNDSNTVTAQDNNDQVAEPVSSQSPADANNAANTRPLNVRSKSSKLTFSSAAADRDTQIMSEPLAEGAEDALDRDDAVTYASRTPRRMLARGGTFDNRSMYSTSSAVTVAEAQTKYVNMLLALDHIHTINDVLAFVFCWLLLAGFVVLPGTFKETIPELVDGQVQDEELRNALNLVVQNVPLVAVAGAVSAVGLIGMVIMWVRWRGNYIWLVRNIFLPGCTNALVGLISTLVNIFVINKGHLDTLSIVVLSVVGGVTVVNFGLIMIYQFIMLGGLQREHKQLVGKHSSGKTGAGKYKGFDGQGGGP